MAKEAKQAEKLETKLKLLTQGYIVRADQLAEQVPCGPLHGAARRDCAHIWTHSTTDTRQYNAHHR
jgi:hypothetical protein